MRVISLTEPELIRPYLETDRVWAAYALGDLDPRYSRQAEWYGAGDDDVLRSIVLRYGGLLSGQLLFTMGDVVGVAAILDRVFHSDLFLDLSVPAEHWPVFEARYVFDDRVFGFIRPMWRMALDTADFKPVAGVVIRLKTPDAGLIQAVYSAGGGGDAFMPSQLATGVCFGTRVGSRLLAVAGTHLVSDLYSVAAIGNVATHPDHRGQGYATMATSAVCAGLIDRGIHTIVLNVAQDNLAAIRVYEKLGFKKHLRFYEGRAARKVAAAI